MERNKVVVKDVKYPAPKPPPARLLGQSVKKAILDIGFPIRRYAPAPGQYNPQTVGVPPRRKSRAHDLPIILAALEKRKRRAERLKEHFQSMVFFGNKSAVWIQTPDGRIGSFSSFMVRKSERPPSIRDLYVEGTVIV